MKTKNGDLPAMPSGVLQDGYNCGEYPLHPGLTKRERFAMAMAQGILSNPYWNQHGNCDLDSVAVSASQYADALLTELERTK